MELLISLLISAAFGYVGAKLANLSGPWYIYLLLGLLGGMVGNFVFGFFGFSGSGLVAQAIISIVGAIIVIAIYRALVRR